MIFSHSRFQIWNQNQHPYAHQLSELRYAHKSLPNIINAEDALNYIIAVLYPNSKDAVATKADLPTTGNVINDYRVVLDDGDGRSAGYRWEQREGEAVAFWHKIADFDWGSDEILQAWQNRTQDLFVMRGGYDDIDENGNRILGELAGQRLFGGKTENSNLTLSANSGDGTGIQTGAVQVTDNFKPVYNNILELGTSASRWFKGWINNLFVGTTTITSGSINDTSGNFTFNSLNLSTNGTASIGNFRINGSTSQITNTTGAISFDNENLSTTGTLSSASLTTGNITGTNATLTKVIANGAASQFSAGTTIANLTFANGSITAPVSLTLSPIITDGVTTNSIGSFSSEISINSPIISDYSAHFDQITAGGYSYLYGGAQISDLHIASGTISSLTANGSLTLTPNGTGKINVGASVIPTATGFDLGASTKEFSKLWITGSIGGATQITITDLLKIRNANYRDSARTQAAQAGDSLFWSGTEWLASRPDTEITHNTVSGLVTGDAGHTQFAMLAGRSGGQVVQGGTAASENLTLESTSNVTKGVVYSKDNFVPFTDSAKDLGTSLLKWKDIYTSGQVIGMRLENVSTLPSSSGTKIGRLVYLTTDSNVYSDTGLGWRQVGGTRFYTDTVWNGTETTKDVTVSGVDARLAIWQLKDNNNDFECMYVEIKSTSATNVRITVSTALPAGSYRLVGV